MEKEQKKVLYRFGLPIILGTILLLGVSYAWLSLTLTGTKTNVLKAGTLSLILDDSMGEGINLAGTVPMLDEVGMQTVPYHFTLTNNGDIDSAFTLYLNDVALESTETKMPNNVIKYNLVKDGVSKNLDLLSTLGTTRVLDSGIIKAGESYEYDLRLWLDENATLDVAGSVFKGKIRVEASQLMQAPLKTLKTLLLQENALGENGSIAEVGNTTYIRGTDPNNYVWYSGMPWRVMSIDSTGQLKLIYDGLMVAWYYGPKSGMNTWDTSFAKEWLNNYMYPRMDSSKDTILVNSSLCLDTVDSSDSARSACTSVDKNSKIVLPTTDEINLIRNGDANSYIMDNKISSNDMFWIASRTTDGSSTCYGSYGNIACGGIPGYGPSFAYRPVITMQEGVVTLSGSGTESDPYRIKGDSVGSSGDNLSTRHSGEYVSYDNKLFRILEQNDQGVKVIYWGDTVSYTQLDFSQTPLLSTSYGIGKNLQTLISDKSKVVENAVWYQGDEASNLATPMNTTLKQSNPITMTVGLISLGEIFYSSLPYFSWTLQLPYYADPSYLTIDRQDSPSSWPILPVIYLQSNTTIASGEGTITSPYLLNS